MGLYPVGLDLSGLACLVVGGGDVAERKALGLLRAGARVTVVAPTIAPGLHASVEAKAISWLERMYGSDDLEGASLVMAATDDESVNRQVSDDARRRRIPVNVCDRPELCSFTVPAVLRQGDLTVAVFTGGQSPMLARRIREELEQHFGPEYAEFLAMLGELRQRLPDEVPDIGRRQAIYRTLVDSDARELLRQGRRAEVEAMVRELVLQTKRAQSPE